MRSLNFKFPYKLSSFGYFFSLYICETSKTYSALIFSFFNLNERVSYAQTTPVSLASHFFRLINYAANIIFTISECREIIII